MTVVADNIRRSRVHRRGYVLLVTLGLLVLASTLLVAVGRLAVQRALAAHIEQDALQRRWGAVSCRAALLPLADAILTRAGGATPVYRTSVALGQINFDLIVSDEQAKANVNGIIDDADVATAENRVRDGLSGTGVAGAVLLRPNYLITATDDSSATTRPTGPRPWITGLGQLFDQLPPDRLVGGFSPADRVTCWGSGAVNIMRAGAPAMRIALTPQLTGLEIDRIIEARTAMLKDSRPLRPAPQSSGGPPPPPVDADVVTRLLYEARIDVKHRSKLALTGVSACHSLWVVARDRQRSWYSLFVSDESNAQRPRTECFEW